ncbi:YigZ family protein [Fictibacillus aquaticus]|uniref:YigZ family protein n=1 Tax=Fictibacillus aquaticus TaxID=2021314 RepID=A0A235FEF0_9BACL|nr:YigZ family protein [Fictibacillus aquaticus]OYD59756.1 YigZ family protein [Fictibacillus aquaticus]
MLLNYLTVKTFGDHEIIIDKSRFIAHFKRTETEEEAVAFIQEIKKKHSSATHNCSAYLIGEHDQIQKANDDGEPSGTAGVPMLEVLKKRKLKDVTVVVTRYFGGIKLGAGGLIRAYGKSVSEGLNEIGIVERKWTQIIETEVDYTWLGTLEQQIRQSNYELKEIQYLENVSIYTYVPSEETDAFISWMTNLTNGRARIELKESIYLESDYK